jgi:hypothetical protein
MTETTEDRAATLAKAADAVHAALKHSAAAAAEFKMGEPMRAQAERDLDTAVEQSRAAMGCLNAAGIYTTRQGRRTADAFDLSALANIDSPDARELLTVLQHALVIAERVDEQRGNSLPESFPRSPSEPRGCDLAEDIGAMVLRLQSEVGGAKGRD